MKKNCPQCNKEFEVKGKGFKAMMRTYCGRECNKLRQNREFVINPKTVDNSKKQ